LCPSIDASPRWGFSKFLKSAAVLTLLALSLILSPTKAAQAKYAALVMDAETGELLYARNATSPKYPASLTKMMTLYLLFGALDSGRMTMNQPLKVSKRAASQPPSRLGLKAGKTISVQDAILALVTKSANDVASVIAENMAPSESQFAVMMTAQARRLGMRNTTFRNASGLHNNGQMSSALDMALLSRALMKTFPNYYPYFSTKAFAYGGRSIGNHNNLMRTYPGSDGLKTGYTRQSGFNLAFSAQRDGRRVIGVVFGGRSPSWRDAHMASLLDQGFGVLEARAKGQSYTFAATEPVAPPAKSGKKTRTIPPGATLAGAALKQAPKTETVKAPPEVSLDVASIPPAPPAPPTPPASLRESERGPWGVQVGAFGDPEAARERTQQAQQHLLSYMPPPRAVISAVKANGKQLFRARLMGMSEPRARTACSKLKEFSTECLVVAPTGETSVAALPR